MESSSDVIKKCWQDIFYEKTLEKTGVVDEHHYSSLMRPFIAFGGCHPEQGSVVLQWLNLVAGDEWTEQEELVIFEDDNEFSFNGMQMVTRAALPLANVDFSLSVNIKTRQAGNIVSNLPENLRWNDESKALCVDPTAGVIKFISGQNIICESFSRVNDDKWHEIAVVYSNEDESLGLYIDKRMESLQYYQLPEESQQYELKIGMAPLNSGHDMANFVGSMKKFVYYRSTKYNDIVGEGGKCINISKVVVMYSQKYSDKHFVIFAGPVDFFYSNSFVAIVSSRDYLDDTNWEL